MLLEDMKDRLKQAMRNKNEVERNILRVVISEAAAIENSPNQAGKPVENEQVHKILRKIIQSNVETLVHNPANAEILTKENIIMNEFLPQLLSADEIRAKLLAIDAEIKAVKSDGQACGTAIKFFKSTGDAVDGSLVKLVVEGIRNNV